MGVTMNARRLTLLFLISAPLLVCTLAADNEPALTADDKKYLDGLMKDFLFDPKGAERVSVKVEIRNAWAHSSEDTAQGWYVPGLDGARGRVYFTDGGVIAAPPAEQMKKVDFIAACKILYTPVSPKKGEEKK